LENPDFQKYSKPESHAQREAFGYRRRALAALGVICRRGSGHETVSLRFPHWAQCVVIERIFQATLADVDFEYVVIDGTIISAHQKASGEKG